MEKVFVTFSDGNGKKVDLTITIDREKDEMTTDIDFDPAIKSNEKPGLYAFFAEMFAKHIHEEE